MNNDYAEIMLRDSSPQPRSGASVYNVISEMY